MVLLCLHGVLSHSYGVFVGDSLRSPNAFTALTMRALCFHDVCNCADGVLKTQGRDFPTIPKFWAGPVEFGKIAFLPSKLGKRLFCLIEQDIHYQCKALHVALVFVITLYISIKL